MTRNGEDTLRFLPVEQSEVRGTPLAGMLVQGATGALGTLQGFVVDPAARRVQYLVVRTAGLFGRPRLLPISAARVDFEGHAIELLDLDVLQQAQPFAKDQYPAFDDEDLVTAIFAPRPAA